MADKLKRDSAGRLHFLCPACNCPHLVVVNGPTAWQWNGSMTAPTFSPSIKVTGTQPMTDVQVDRVMRGEKVTPQPLCCHSFVTDGIIDFLGDCTHSLRGRFPLPDWDSKWD